MKYAASLGVATRREGGRNWRKVEDVRADCKVRKCTEQQACASPTQARKVRKRRAVVTERCGVRAESSNGSADLESSLLAHIGGPGSAGPNQAAPATPSSVANLLRKILSRHAGSFAFQDIPDQLKYVGPGEETAYSQLNQMYEEGELREFVEAQCEFFECERVGARMFIRWAGDSAHESEIGDQSCQSGSGPFWSDSDENIL